MSQLKWRKYLELSEGQREANHQTIQAPPEERFLKVGEDDTPQAHRAGRNGWSYFQILRHLIKFYHQNFILPHLAS